MNKSIIKNTGVTQRRVNDRKKFLDLGTEEVSIVPPVQAGESVHDPLVWANEALLQV